MVKIGQTGKKWSKCSNCSKRVKNDQKWSKTIENGQKRSKMCKIMVKSQYNDGGAGD